MKKLTDLSKEELLNFLYRCYYEGAAVNLFSEVAECAVCGKDASATYYYVCDDCEELLSNRAIVISGFPGIGKTFCDTVMETKLTVLDADSSKFHWFEEGVKHTEFPHNYMEFIKGMRHRVDLIFVSSHKDVRDNLMKHKLNVTLVFPEKNLKEEYLQRYGDRGSDQKFIEMMDRNWDLFIDDMADQKGCNIVRLKSGEFLSDVLDKV